VHDHPSGFEHVDLDEGNESELSAHQISASEAVQTLAGSPAWVANKKGRAGRWLAVGRTNGGRRLTIVVAYDVDRRQIRPITGWATTQGEITRYG